MYKKQYGRMTVRGWLNSEMDCASAPLTVGAGVLLLIAGLIVRFKVGGPYRVMMEMGIGELVPPVWLMGLLWSLSLFLIGCAAGFVLGYKKSGYAIEKYKGCMVFVLLSVLELVWYYVFFGKSLVFISVLISIGVFVLSLWITALFYRVTKFAGMLFLLHDIWLLYMVILNCAVFFRV